MNQRFLVFLTKYLSGFFAVVLCFSYAQQIAFFGKYFYNIVLFKISGNFYNPNRKQTYCIASDKRFFRIFIDVNFTFGKSIAVSQPFFYTGNLCSG